jgi:hypothetical protein
MIETLATATIIVSSILLFCYWFRYVCLLILSAETSHDYATNIAQTHQLGFREAHRRLNQGATELDPLKEVLDHDYAVLARLMNHAGNSQVGIEQRMVAIHYRLMALSYRATNRFSASAARKALEQMSMVVAHFANFVGETASSPAAA